MSDPQPQRPRTALVTGANRGLGYTVSEQLGRQGLQLIIAARDPALGEQAAAELRQKGLVARAEVLDVTRADSVQACAERLQAAGVTVDVLVNNAGVNIRGAVLDTAPESFRTCLEVNLFGALHCSQVFVPGMLARGYGRIVNVSSIFSSLSAHVPGAAAYSVSKAALNMLTVQLANELRGDVKVNAAHPGWLRTRMGGPEAPLSAEEGADTIVWLATLPASGPSGGLFSERAPLAY